MEIYKPYPLVFLVIVIILVSLGGHYLAIRYRHAKHTRLNKCLRGYDKSHKPESLYKGDRGNGPETLAKRSSIELKGEEVSLRSHLF